MTERERLEKELELLDNDRERVERELAALDEEGES